MATIINPRVIAPPQPVNLDAFIYKAQLQLADGLPWLTRSFGRAWKMYQKRDGMGSSEGLGRGYAFPGVFAGKKEYFNCFPNDTLAAYSFWSPRDTAEPATSSDAGSGSGQYEPGIKNEWRQPVDLIVWFNCNKVQPGSTYPLTENLLAQVRKVLRRISFFTPTGVYYQPENIFEGYSMDYVQEQYLSHPYGGFRIAGDMQFLENDAFGECDPFVFPQL